MNTQDIEKIIKIFEGADISHLDLEIDNIKIKLDKKETQGVKYVPEVKEDAFPLAEPDNSKEIVKAPLVGTFYKAPSADAKPFVTVGSTVKKGDKLCIIEAMKVMNEITSPCDGVVKEILAENEKMVEYGQKLFIIGD
ncbi:MAG: acetyl-CoA carboxylase biotin carboxyl carrier protein [Acholeplasmatales bacterium]|nr:acetyl-CoA carboxylase biotin carboxyl carrier protein [Acholeplasmatales bacterium]